MMSTDLVSSPGFARRVGSLQTLCQGVILGLVGLTIGFWMVVSYALDGIPLAGNLFQIGGVSVVVWVAGFLAIAAVIAAPMVGRTRTRAGLERVAASHPELAGSADETEQMLDVFASSVFAEYAVAGGTALVLAVTFHLTSLFPILGFVTALVVFLGIRYPTVSGARVWLTAAQGELAIKRRPFPR